MAYTFLRLFRISVPAILTITLLAGVPAEAEACAPLDAVRAALQEQYSEHRVASGRLGNGGRVELYANQSGDWTIVIVNPRGCAGILLHGDGLERHVALPEPGRDT